MPTGLLTPPFGRSVALNRASPLARGLVLLQQTDAATLDLVTGRRGTPSNTKPAASEIGPTSGYGATYGTGTNDRIITALKTSSAQRTWAFWAWRSANGGCYAAQWNASNFFNITDDANFGGVVKLEYGWSGGTASFRAPRPSASVWAHVVIAYDNTSTSNVPTIWVNGEAKSVTTGTAPTGTPLTSTDFIYLGNRQAFGGGIAWAGKLGPAAIWDRLLTVAEVRRLYNPDTRWELYRPLSGLPWRIVAQAGAAPPAPSGPPVGTLMMMGIGR